jgi:hypothetical protein
MRPGISVDESINADLYACPSCAIWQRIDPVSVDLSRQNVHLGQCIPQATGIKGRPKQNPALRTLAGLLILREKVIKPVTAEDRKWADRYATDHPE